MTTNNKNLINLLQYLEDSRNGYTECSQDVKDQDLKVLFTNLIGKRQDMIAELKAQVFSSENELPNDGTLLGSAHQYFIKLKSLLTGGDRDAIIAEVERGETTAINQFTEALKEELTPSQREVVAKHLQILQADLLKVKAQESAI